MEPWLIDATLERVRERPFLQLPIDSAIREPEEEIESEGNRGVIIIEIGSDEEQEE